MYKSKTQYPSIDILKEKRIKREMQIVKQKKEQLYLECVDIDEGLMITKVYLFQGFFQLGLGFKLGLRVGDVITHVNGYDLSRYNSRILIDVFKNSTEVEITVLESNNDVKLN